MPSVHGNTKIYQCLSNISISFFIQEKSIDIKEVLSMTNGVLSAMILY